ncbi:MAG: winged helix-turn-helix domain-containing protein [Rhodothermales bacterium]
MHGSFQIGDYFVEPRFNRIQSGMRVVQVAPKYMHVLTCLADGGGDVVTRAELMEVVWPETVVSDESLTRAISELRSVFADAPPNPTYIETIRGRGYRLLTPVTYTAAPRPGMSTDVQDRGAASKPLVWRRPLHVLAFGIAILVLLGAALLSLKDLGAESPPYNAAYQARPVTSTPGLEVDPALSPDGRRVAFAQATDGPHFDVYIKTLGEATTIRLTDTPSNERRPAWSPDGRMLALVRSAAECEVLLVPAQGGAPQTLAACTAGTMPVLSWSPDGAGLVWPERSSPEAPLHLMEFNLAARTKTQLTTPPPLFSGDGYPAFSPDGSTLAFVRTQAFGIQEVYLYDYATGTTRQHTTDETKIGGLTWAPDGSGLFFSSKRSGFYGLWYVPRAGGAPQWANASYENVHHPSMGQHGARRVYERRVVDTNIWRLPLAPDTTSSASQPWITSTRWEGYPAVSPGGQQIAFTSDRSGSPELWISDMDGSQLRKVTAFEGPFVGSPQWSPDGKRLVFEARAQGNADVYLFNLETGVQERLTTDSANDVVPRWSRDGRAVYFGSNRAHGWQLWRKSLADEVVQRVTEEGGYIGMESMDGTTLYYVKHATAGLWAQRVSGGAATLLLEDVSPAYGKNWLVTERGLYFIRQPQGLAAHVIHYDVHTGTSTSLWQASYPIAASGLALSPDHLFYVQVDRDEGDIIVEEPFTQ